MRFLATVVALIFALAQSVVAQDSSTPPPKRGATPSPAPELIPADLLSPAERAPAPASAAPAEISIPQLDESFKPKPLSTVTESAARHAEWRQLQNRVTNDPDLKAALRKTETARTDLAKRTLLRDYYQLRFRKMLALASTQETRVYLEARKLELLNSLQQPRVRPTPSPTPTPTPAPAPVLILPQPDLPAASPAATAAPSPSNPSP